MLDAKLKVGVMLKVHVWTSSKLYLFLVVSIPFSVMLKYPNFLVKPLMIYRRNKIRSHSYSCNCQKDGSTLYKFCFIDWLASRKYWLKAYISSIEIICSCPLHESVYACSCTIERELQYLSSHSFHIRAGRRVYKRMAVLFVVVSTSLWATSCI